MSYSPSAIYPDQKATLTYSQNPKTPFLCVFANSASNGYNTNFGFGCNEAVLNGYEANYDYFVNGGAAGEVTTSIYQYLPTSDLNDASTYGPLLCSASFTLCPSGATDCGRPPEGRAILAK